MSDEDRLHGFSTDDEDSSDEEALLEGGIDVGTLPTIAKDDATIQRKLARAQRQSVRLFAHVPFAHAHPTPDTRPRRRRDQPSAPWLLRGPAPCLFRAVWRGRASACLPE